MWVGFPLYDAESDEHRFMAEDTHAISLRDFSNRGSNAEGQRIAADAANKPARTMNGAAMLPRNKVSDYIL